MQNDSLDGWKIQHNFHFLCPTRRNKLLISNQANTRKKGKVNTNVFSDNTRRKKNVFHPMFNQKIQRFARCSSFKAGMWLCFNKFLWSENKIFLKQFLMGTWIDAYTSLQLISLLSIWVSARISASLVAKFFCRLFHSKSNSQQILSIPWKPNSRL